MKAIHQNKFTVELLTTINKRQSAFYQDMSKYRKLNLRDLGTMTEGAVPEGLFLRSGKLSILSEKQIAKLCTRYGIGCVIDLRTSVESAEFPDILPNGIEHIQIPLLKDATVGITHETGSDPMTIVKKLRKHPEKLKAMIPDIKTLYTVMVTDDYSRLQLDKVVQTMRQNADKGICTLFHCTAGKDRTGIVSMALLKSYGVSDEIIIRDYLRTNRNACWPTFKKCVGVALMTQQMDIVKTVYHSFMAQRELIEMAIRLYRPRQD